MSYQPHSKNYTRHGIRVLKNIAVLGGKDGLFYIAPVSDPTFHGGTTGYLHLSHGGLVATDFTRFDFTTSTSGTAHPNFAGDTMLFGLAQFTGAAITTRALK